MIKLENVNLSIPISSYDKTLKKKIISSFTGCFIKRKDNGIPYVNVLSNINCVINRGDRVALIGVNGSGKTSFLRLISGIYSATNGKLIRDLDVYPIISKSFLTSTELSGFVAAQAYYLMLKKTKKGFDEYMKNIIDFSGIGDYIYLPLKTYSQGMQSRLQFTLLTSLNIECLALDEGFGFGDINFRNKAKSKLDNFIDNAGTLIFASHSEDLLKKYCTRGLVLRKGELVFDGNLEAALDFYNDK